MDEKVLDELVRWACMSADQAVFADYEATLAMTGAGRTRLVVEAAIRGLVENGVIDLPTWDDLMERMGDGYVIT